MTRELLPSKPKSNGKKANAASTIAKEQNKVKTYTVFGPDWDASATTSGKAWTTGQKLDNFEDIADFYSDMVSEKLGEEDKPLALSKRQVADAVHMVLGDTGEKQEERIDHIWSEHTRLKPGVSVGASDTTIDPNIEMLADKLAPTIGQEIDKGWEGFKVVRYIAAQLAHDVQLVLTPEEIEMVPPADSQRPAKAAGTNIKYNKLYRAKIKGIDRGPPSWIGDLYNKMPDCGTIRLGQSVLKLMTALDPDNQGVQAIKQKDPVKGRALNALYVQLKTGTKNLTDAFRLIQRMELINSFDMLDCAFATDIEGNVDVQNLSPIRVTSWKNEINTKTKIKEKVVSSVGYFNVSEILSWYNIENMPKNATAGSVVGSKKVRDTTLQPIDKSEELVQHFKRVSDWFNPTSSRHVGKVMEFEKALFKTQTVGDEAGLPADQSLHNSALWLARLLAPHLNTLEAIDKAIHEKDKDKRATLMEQNTKMLTALAREKAGMAA